MARRVGWAFGTWFVLFLAYRVVFVYTFAAVPCPAPAASWATMSQSSPSSPSNGQVERSRDSTVAAEHGRSLKVLTYNIAGHTALLNSRHVAAVARLIAAQHPDVVGLQEVHRGTWQSRFHDQASEIARQTGMEIFYGPSFKALGGEFGNAVLVRGRVLHGEVVPLPSFGEPRSLLRAAVEVDGLALDVFVTHLTAWGSLNSRQRTAQARCLVEQVLAAGGSERPFILCGDLNAAPTSPELEALMHSDLVRLCGLASETTHALLGRRIDYIFSDPRFEVLEASVLREGPSDHWPVLARLVWPGGASR